MTRDRTLLYVFGDYPGYERRMGSAIANVELYADPLVALPLKAVHEATACVALVIDTTIANEQVRAVVRHIRARLHTPRVLVVYNSCLAGPPHDFTGSGLEVHGYRNAINLKPILQEFVAETVRRTDRQAARSL
jgi:hypothetical protein